VGDEEDFRFISIAKIKQILKDQSFEFVEARDGEEALALLKRGVKPSMIILDYTLPKINGIELLRRIDSDHRDLILPVYGQRNLVYHASESQLAS
jgi:CheY-like chemotaxis protein